MGLPGLRSRASLLEAPRKLTAELPQSSSSWACYLVFKDRAACSPSRLVLPSPTFHRVPFNHRGRTFYFNPRNLSTTCFRCFPSVCSELRATASFFPFLREGRGFYVTAASRVNTLRRPFISPRSRFVGTVVSRTSRGGGRITTASPPRRQILREGEVISATKMCAAFRGENPPRGAGSSIGHLQGSSAGLRAARRSRPVPRSQPEEAGAFWSSGSGFQTVPKSRSQRGKVMLKLKRPILLRSWCAVWWRLSLDITGRRASGCSSGRW
jgi:hypothetical protein